MTAARDELAVIVNIAAGATDKRNIVRQIAETFRLHDVNTRVEVADEGANIPDLARAFVREGYKLIVAGGGDGTVRAVASALVDADAILGILPVGTLNHFASDLAIPPDLQQAVRVIAAGKVAEVDVGEVNGHIFLNNSSLGMYPSIVAERENLRRTVHSKSMALFWATLAVLRRFHFVHIHLIAQGEHVLRTPFVLIANNAYQIEGREIGTRVRLDSGLLYLYLANVRSRRALLWLCFRALVGFLPETKELDTLSVPEARIDTRRRRLRVALDGELAEMRPPLLYRIRARALRVIVP